MFEDLIPSAPAQTPAPPPGLFDDLIPAGGAAGVASAAKIAVPGGADEQALPRSTAGTDPGEQRIAAPARNGQLAVAASSQTNARGDTSAPPGLFDDLIPRSAASRALVSGPSVTPDAVPSGLAAAITDIPREVGATTREAWENLRRALPSTLGGERDMASEGPFESVGRTGKGLLAAAALPFAPLQGAVRSLIGHPMVAVDQALRRGAVGLYGEDKVGDSELATGQTPGGMTYDEARRRADIVPHLMPPRGGTAVLRPPPQTNPPGPAPNTGPRGFPPPPTQGAPGEEPVGPDETTSSRERASRRDTESSESQAQLPERSPERSLPVPLAARLTGDELGQADSLGELRQLARQYGRDNLAGRTFVNRMMGYPIVITNSGIDRSTSGAKGPDLLRMIPAVPDMIEHGQWLHAEPDRYGRSSIRAVHIFESAIELGGKRFNTIFFVRETNDGKFFYDYGIRRSDTGVPSGPER